jgi:hypothetical protein
VTHIEELKEAIHHMHGVESTHVESVPVKETFQGKTVWEGVVEVFDLHGHPTATRPMRGHMGSTMQKCRHVAVLHLDPVTSAIAAVRAAIVQEFRNAEAEES